MTSTIGKDAVNCEESEKLGEEIHKKQDGETMATATIKRKDQFKSLESLINTVKIGDSSEIINPTILFTRLTAMAQREEDVEKNFNYEMSPFPPSIFKDDLIKKPDKPSLRKAIMKVNDAIGKEDIELISTYVLDGGALLHRLRWSKDIMKVNDAIRKEDIELISTYVLDGGALLHRLRWSKDTLFGDLAYMYVSYVRRHYGSAIIVFDGYLDVSTKDGKHARRARRNATILT